IYHDYFLLDFESRINNETILRLKEVNHSKITPLYQYFSNIRTIKSKQLRSKKNIQLNLPNTNPSQSSLDFQEFESFNKEIKKKILKRLKYMEIFEQGISTKELKKYADKIGINITTLYRWKKKYNQLGWRGLIPNNNKAGRKKGFGKLIEDLIQKTIKEHYLINLQPSIMSSYKFFKIKCFKQKIPEEELPSYETFRVRVHEISKTEKTLYRRGRKELRDNYNPIIGKYPFGKHPLDLIEFDHTQLDIILLDRKDRQPIGRPTLTLAIDVYSRMIYGYYLSFDPPNTIAVGMCLLNGILPKKDITRFYDTINEWIIHGVPKNILLDNSKEFRSQALFNFCERYRIKQRFNPVHRPDLKPHIERAFKTINEAMRDDGILGYTATIEDNRKTKYNPSNYAILTIEELENWLVHWIVDEYHMRFHNGIKEKEGIDITPFEKYKRGIENSEGRIIGNPKVPKDWEQLSFDLLPFEKRTLQREGVRLFNLKYYHSIISKLRASQTTSNLKYIIKYDPRDIREVYLWVDSEKKYYKLSLIHSHLPELMINPKNPKDYPLSLKEFELMKKEKIRKSSSVSQRDLAKTMENRQSIISNAKKLKKSSKSARKREEKMQVHKQKATSTKIRENNRKKSKEMKEVQNFVPSIKFTDKQKDNDKDSLIKPKIYSVSFWEENSYEDK
ncbi:MAG: Mu transposase C-terminal domain-containing protein, partial [Candidatus Thorarchaeota archaeon]